MSETDPNLPTETDPVAPAAIEPVQPIVEPVVPVIDYEKKFADSTRENQILQAKLAEQERARQELTKEPTDSDLRTAFPSWDLMSDTEKELARRTIAAERKAGSAAQSVNELQATSSWATSIELAIASNNALQGKEQAFQQYASRPQYRNVPMDVLVPAFLQSQGTAPAAPAPTPKPALLTGNGGPRTPEKPQHISAADLATLRKTDEKAYMEYVRTHDIDVDNL